ncbi:MAG: T9SS type A sorting domain-containing protein [Candidatus Latescibacteria bacterium]|nr:T9SS type A sorting domain-containing protein [Candidatus Latescibacterota bacterium]
MSSILLGYGDGTFADPAQYTVGGSPNCIIIKDLNEDEVGDMVVANGGANEISIRLGTGGGTFGAVNKIDVGVYTSSVTAGDFNEDGHKDLAIAGEGAVPLLLGVGDGTFISGESYDSSGISIAAADYNGDTHEDLAIVKPDPANNVSIMIGCGDGTFSSAVNYDAGDDPQSVTSGDFNEDNNIDLAVANMGSDNVSILLGAGDGTFNLIDNFKVAMEPRYVAASDFDNDSHVDLAVANSVSDNVSILMGIGDGTFINTVNYTTVGENPLSVTSADFNNDNRTDLGVLSYEGGLTILMNISEGGSATMLSSYLCSAINDGIEITWTLSESSEDLNFSIHRETDGSGAFLPIDAKINRINDLSYKAFDRSCRPGTGYRYRVDVTDDEGTRTLFITEVINIQAPKLALSQNYPNPFNPSTTIYYSLPERSHVTLDIFDVSGRRIARLVDAIREAGTHQAKWSGLNVNGASVSSGVYFYKLTAGKGSITRKMVLMK